MADDGRYGRDAAATAGVLPKTGGGAAGFDFTKIANDGNELPAGAMLGIAASDWACTRDNVTGLTWEVKTTSGLRSQNHTYSWYSTNGATNGGDAGSDAVTNTCGNPATLVSCNTEAYVIAINALPGPGLCGNTDWRLPSSRELLSITHRGAMNPVIDATYFPNTVPSLFWSASTYAPGTALAWTVFFDYGIVYAVVKTGSWHLRLVRGGQL